MGVCRMGRSVLPDPFPQLRQVSGRKRRLPSLPGRA